jgi:uncharacterized protein YggE
MYRRGLGFLFLYFFASGIHAQRNSVIEMKVDATYFYESYPDMVLLDFLIYSESESKGSVPIENVESLVMLEMQKQGIPAYQLNPSSDMYSINPKYKKYRMILNSKEEYDFIFPYLNNNPFIQSLKIAKKIYLKETKKTLAENLIKGVWHEMEAKSFEMAAIQNKKISKIDEIDATQLFDLNLHEKENTQSYFLKKDRFVSQISARFQIHDDANYFIRRPTYLIVLGEGADTFPSNHISLKFDVFNNEIKKSQISLLQINQNVLAHINKNSIVDFEQRQDEYEDVIRYEFSHLTYNQYVSMIDFLSQNKNVINIEVKQNPWNEASYDLTKSLWLKAINDAKQKANKVAKLLNKDIVSMKELENWEKDKKSTENKWVGRSEAYSASDWRHLGQIQKKEILRVVFELD